MGDENQIEVEDLYKKFEALLSGSALTDDEKQELSRDILKIVFSSSNEVRK